MNRLRELLGSRWSLLASVLTPSLFFLYGGYVRRWAGDDGFINLRVVRQLLAGNGFVFNAGERCEAVTSAAWVLVLWAFGELGLDIEDVAWISSLAFGALGVGLSVWGSALLSEDDEPGAIYLPFAALAYVSIPVAWDYATSALENGLGVGYLGASYFLVARAIARSVRSQPWMALLIGVGPLVRPDYVLYAAPLTLLLLASTEGNKRRALVAVCAALPGATFQIFRMGYFASLVPNTAIAKEAFEARWDQGYLFLKNTFGTYGLVVPLLCVLFYAVPLAFKRTEERAYRRALLPLAMGGAGALHLLYVVRVGGDFMHGRMLLPGLFALFTSAAVMRVSLRMNLETIRQLTAWAVLACWAFVCATWLRVEIYENQVLDERRWYSDEAKHQNPTRAEHYGQHKFYAGPLVVKNRIAEGCDGGLVALDDDSRSACRRVALPDPLDGVLADRPAGTLLPLAEGAAAPEVVAVYGFRPLGLSSSAVGLRINVTDSFGLADPLAARTELTARGRPGHEKTLSTVWFAAKYVADGATTDASVHVAKRALGCGLLRKLHRATHEPLTMSRFLTNLRLAFKLHSLRLPADPNVAVERFCTPSS